EAMLDDMAARIKSLLTDGRTLRARLSLDRKVGELDLSLNLTAKSGTTLARRIAGLGLGRTVGSAVIGSGSAAHGNIGLGLPEDLRKHLPGAVDDLVKKALEKEKDKGKRALLGDLLEALKPTAKAGVVDMGFDLRGPGKGGKYTLVAGVRVKDGGGIEKVIKKGLAKLPAKDNKAIKLDVDTAEGGDNH